MAIYDKLDDIRRITTSSLSSIVTVSNENFNDLSSAVREFLSNIEYNEDTNSAVFDSLELRKLEVTQDIRILLNGVPTFTVDDQGRITSKSFLVEIGEAKRYRHTDFPDWPDNGVPGEIIYTGIQNQRPEFGEDFIGYLDGRGWVSLTGINNGLFVKIVGSPGIPDTPGEGTGLIWLGNPGLETTYDIGNSGLYLSDDEGNIFNLLDLGPWEDDGTDATLRVDGDILPKTATLNLLGTEAKPWGGLHIEGNLQYKDGNEVSGYVLTTDDFGNATWQPPTGGGGGPALPNLAYTEVVDLTAGVPTTITHNLGTENIQVQAIHVAGSPEQVIDVEITNHTTVSVDITSSKDLEAVKIVVLADGGLGIESNLQIQDEGLLVGSNVTKINFTGELVQAFTFSPDTNCVEVNISGLTSGSTDIIVVNATGTDFYEGTAEETQTDYRSDAIYLVTFENGNTGIGSPNITTLDIDNLGAFEIVKGTEAGFVPLDAGDIVAGLTYYLIWDGGQFQFFTELPEFAPLTYTNLNPVPQKIGGILAGTTFNNTPLQEMWDQLLYPYLIPQFKSFFIQGQPTTVEVGTTIPAGPTTFRWLTTNPSGITPNTVRIQNITGGTVTLGSGLADDSIEVLNLPTPITKTGQSSHLWRIKANRDNGTIMSRNFRVRWFWRKYWGTSLNPTLTEPQLEALPNNPLSNNFKGTHAFAAGGYKYYAVQQGQGTPSLFRDKATNLAVAMAGAAEGYTDTNGGPYNFKYLTVTNAQGVTTQYRVYRTKYILGGSIDIIVT